MTTIGNNAQKALQAFVERYERVSEEIASLTEDRKEILQEAKNSGFDVKAIRECIKLRKADEAARVHFEGIVTTYRHALGISTQLEMFDGGKASSPIAALGAAFDQLMQLADGGATSEIHAGAVKLAISKDEAGNLLIHRLDGAKTQKKKAA